MSASQERASGAGGEPVRDEFVRESIGAYLAAQRQLRGISVQELSQQTRIPLRSLERLEAGSFDGDIDGFVRGFVRTVAEALGLDPDETLNRTLHEPGGAPRSTRPRLSARRVALTFLLLAGLAGVGFAVQIIAAFLREASVPGPRSPIVIRRDPVRDLAEAQGVAALSPAPAAALASAARRPPVAVPRRDGSPGSEAEPAPRQAPAQAPRVAPAEPRSSVEEDGPAAPAPVPLPVPAAPAAPAAQEVTRSDGRAEAVDAP